MTCCPRRSPSLAATMRPTMSEPPPAGKAPIIRTGCAGQPCPPPVPLVCSPARHAALTLNRVSAANFIALTTLLRKTDRVFAFAPAGGVSHPSTVRPISMAGADLREFHSYADLKKAWDGGAPRLLLITPISASKRHIPFAEFKQALA